MISRDFTISNKLGLHARPSAQLTQTASRFVADIHVSRAGRRVNAKRGPTGSGRPRRRSRR